MRFDVCLWNGCTTGTAAFKLSERRQRCRDRHEVREAHEAREEPGWLVAILVGFFVGIVIFAAVATRPSARVGVRTCKTGG
jgi:hypothetical protein